MRGARLADVLDRENRATDYRSAKNEEHPTSTGFVSCHLEYLI